MPDYTTPPTATAGQTLSAVNWNTGVRDSIEALAKPYRCKVTKTASHSVPNNAVTPTSWTAEEYDVGAMWGIGTPTDIVVPVSGLYVVTFIATFANNATGTRQWSIFLNAFNIAQAELPGNASTFLSQCIVVEQVAAGGGIFTGRLFQNSGAGLNASAVQMSARLVAR